MLTVEDYGRIRRAHRDGMSIRAIARTFHHSRRKIRETLACPKPRPYTRDKDPPAPKLGPFKPVIDEILRTDEQAPRKQRHTAAQIFRRLRAEHGYTGGYDQVRRYVGTKRHERRETFIPLAHDPGRRLECDFGHIHVDFPEGRRQVPVFIAAWSFSNASFALATPTERTEAILHAMVEAFTFFGCVPREVWWDNPKSVVKKILKGRLRTPNERYAALASHYTFEPSFCMPASGNEKPYAENRVYDLQRRFATPVPHVRDLAELNAHLRTCCLQERCRTVAGQTQKIGERFEADRAAALPVPGRTFDPCIVQAGMADKYQTVRFDSHRYSVPRNCAFRPVTIKGYVDQVHIVADGHLVACHPRSYVRDRQTLDPIHYLAALERRPAALDHSRVYRDWCLPEEFEALRRLLEERHGPSAGARQYIQVLQLLAQHPLARVRQAVGLCRSPERLSADHIVRQTFRLAQRDVPSPADLDPTDPVATVQVDMPDLRQFDQLLNTGERAYV